MVVSFAKLTSGLALVVAVTTSCKQTIIVTPDEPETAVIELDIELAEFGDNPDAGPRFRSVWTVTVRELAGVDVSFEFLRLELWNGSNTPLERSEIGGQTLIDVCGSTIVRGMSEWTCAVPLEFNTDELSGRQVFTFGLRDVLGNVFELVLDSDAPPA